MMKEIRIYHRKELVAKMHRALHRLQSYPEEWREQLGSELIGQKWRRFRIKYGIYECF